MDTIQDVIGMFDPALEEDQEVQVSVTAPRKKMQFDRLWPAELLQYIGAPKTVPLVVEGSSVACPNCGGAGALYVYVWSKGPFRFPDGAKVKWLDGEGIAPGWYKGETHSAPCPVCQDDRRKEYLEANCGLRGRDLETTISTFKAGGPFLAKEPAEKLVRGLLAQNENPKGFVTLWGEPGRGKSHLLKAVVNGFRAVNVYSRYVNAADLLQEIKDNFSGANGGILAEEAIQYYRRVRVLCIDELDKVQLTGWSEQTLHRLLDARFNDQAALLTVLAMKPNPAALPESLDYLASRISGGVVEEVAGGDMRPYQGAAARRFYQMPDL